MTDAKDGTWITTTTLLDRLGDYGDQDAWDRFVERFRRPITSFALEVGVPPRDVEDVTQETLVAFAQAFRAGRYDRARGRLRSWLFESPIASRWRRSVAAPATRSRRRNRTPKATIRASPPMRPGSGIGCGTDSCSRRRWRRRARSSIRRSSDPSSSSRSRIGPPVTRRRRSGSRSRPCTTPSTAWPNGCASGSHSSIP